MMRVAVLVGTTILAACAGMSAYAGSVTFNFNALSENESDSAISTALTSQLQASGCLGCTVTVTGAYADTTWNADGNVTGPGTGSKSYTLGTAPSGLIPGSTSSSTTTGSNVFLATTSDSAATCVGECQIRLTFTGLTLNTINSFNYEIFPDYTCPVLTSSKCGGNGDPNQPDLSLTVGTSTPVTAFGTDGTLLGQTPGTAGAAGSNDPNSNTKSPDSNDELAPQLIGAWTTSLSVTGATELNFVDWPATIAFDDLSLNYSVDPPGVPEPSSLLLFFTVIGGTLLAARKRVSKV